MEVDETLFMGFHNVFRQKESFGNVLADLTGHIVTLNAVNRRIFVRVLLFHFLIIAL